MNSKTEFHLSETGIYAGMPYCSVTRKEALSRGEKPVHYSPAFVEKNRDSICPDCLAILDTPGPNEEPENVWTGKIAVYRSPAYAPCAYIICKAFPCGSGYDWNTRDDANTVLAQCDLDFPSIARTFGLDIPDESHITLQITDAVQYLDECCENGTVVDDPGYFDNGGE